VNSLPSEPMNPISSPRERFTLVRRAYRAACRPSAAIGDVQQGRAIVAARVCACSALRAITGKWDTCERVVSYCEFQKGRGYVAVYAGERERVKTASGRIHALRWHVSNACATWMRRDGGFCRLGLYRNVDPES
jgi:hypothetical protein